MSSISAATVTAANAVVAARAQRDAAVAALTAATTALHGAAFVYRQSLAVDGIQPSDPNSPLALIAGDSSGQYFPNF